MTGTNRSPAELQEVLCRLTTEATAIDVRHFEQFVIAQNVRPLIRELVPAVKSVLEQGIGSLDLACQQYEGSGEDEVGESLSEKDFYRGIDRLMESQRGERQIADLAFVTRRALIAKKETLERLASHPRPDELLELASSCLRRLLKGMAAVESALCSYERRDVRLGFVTEVHRAIEIRRLYAKFRANVLDGGEPTTADVEPRLRRVAVAIAQLVGHDLYGDLRVHDRLQFREIQRRVLGHFADDNPGEKDGLRLYQDLACFTELLREIRYRAELREHDQALLASATAALQPAAENDVPPSLLKRLASLEGLDAELDCVLRKHFQAGREALLRILRRMQVELSGATVFLDQSGSWFAMARATSTAGGA